MARLYANLFERLLANTIESTEHFFNGTPCLCWTGPRTKVYGKVNVWVDGRTLTLRAHRVMAELAVKRKLDPFLETIQHACDTTLCINWLHFEVATNEENARDMQHKRWGKSASEIQAVSRPRVVRRRPAPAHIADAAHGGVPVLKVVDTTPKTVIILAGGPSLTQEQIDAALASGYFTIAVNTTWEKAQAADVLYAGDFLWFKFNIAKVRAAKFKGKVWTQDNSAAARWPGINRIRGTNRKGLGKDIVHINGNSGVQALNLAVIWGYKRIILLGFDMKLGPKGERHHHADHAAPMVQNQTFDQWLHQLEDVAADLRATDCEVLNATPGSAMKCFPLVDWKEVLT